jgi:hypothetical protein
MFDHVRVGRVVAYILPANHHLRRLHIVVPSSTILNYGATESASQEALSKRKTHT